MKKLLALLLALLLPCAAAAESYTDVARHYLSTYGRWWDYSQELWLAYAARTRAADPGNSHAARAIAATEYILPPEDALTMEDAAAIAIAAADPAALARPLIPCFLLEGRAVYKVILYRPEEGTSVSHTVELDAVTGEVLGVYPALLADAGQFFVPNAVWAAVTLQYTPEQLAQMTWSQLFDAYIARYGDWRSWNTVRWGEFVTAVREVDVSMSRTGRAVAATEYVKPPHGALLEAEAAEIARTAVGGSAVPCELVTCFLLDGQMVFKVILRTPDMSADHYMAEVDAMTGSVLSVYPRTDEGVGQFLVPRSVWEATPETAPNG